MAQNPSFNRHVLFAGSYAAADKPGLYAFDFDGATGALTARGSFSGIANPSYFMLHPNRRWLFAVSETGQAQDGAPGEVWALGLDPESLALQPANHQASGGDFPCHLRLDSTGAWLLVSNYGTGSVGLLPVQPGGSLGAMADLVQHHGHGPSPDRQEGPHAHSTIFTPDARLLIVADLGLDRLMLYRLDSAAGKLLPQGDVTTRPGSGPRHMTFGPGGNRLYVASELANTVTVFEYDAADGAFRELQVLDTLPPGAPENTVADIHLSPDGRRLYVSNRGHNSLAVYQVEADGLLKTLAFRPCGGDWPRNFALAPDGRFVLVANQYSGGVDVLPVAPGGDELGPALARAAAPGASCLQFMS